MGLKSSLSPLEYRGLAGLSEGCVRHIPEAVKSGLERSEFVRSGIRIGSGMAVAQRLTQAPESSTEREAGR